MLCCVQTSHSSNFTQFKPVQTSKLQASLNGPAGLVAKFTFTTERPFSVAMPPPSSSYFLSSILTCPWLTFSISLHHKRKTDPILMFTFPNNLCYVDVECLRLFVHRHFPCISLPQDQKGSVTEITSLLVVLVFSSPGTLPCNTAISCPCIGYIAFFAISNHVVVLWARCLLSFHHTGIRSARDFCMAYDSRPSLPKAAL